MEVAEKVAFEEWRRERRAVALGEVPDLGIGRSFGGAKVGSRVRRSSPKAEVKRWALNRWRRGGLWTRFAAGKN